MTEKRAENQIWAKGNNSRKSWPNVTELKLDLCYLKTNSYTSTKFQVNISKDDGEKCGNRVDGHRVDGRTDRRTDRQTDGRTDRETDGEKTNSPPGFIDRRLIKVKSNFKGLAPLMNVLFWGRCDSPMGFSGGDMSGNVWGRLWGSSVVGAGILPGSVGSPSPECYTTFWMMATCGDALHWWDIAPIFDHDWSGPYYRIWPFT